MREHADPRGGYGEVAAAAMAAGAPMPDGQASEKMNGNGAANGDAEVYTSGANVRSGAHWKADGPQRREYIRRWS